MNCSTVRFLAAAQSEEQEYVARDATLWAESRKQRAGIKATGNDVRQPWKGKSKPVAKDRELR